jgi:hypothetical protein
MVQSTSPQSPLRRVAQVFVGGIAAVTIYAGVGIGSADAAGQHRLLARTTFASEGTSANADSLVCRNWTNEDGTHGTNCAVVQGPATGHSETAMATGPTTTTTTPKRVSLTDVMETPLP